jgi:hypothetical protein
MVEAWTFVSLPERDSWIVDASVDLVTLHGSLVSRRVILTHDFLVLAEDFQQHPSNLRFPGRALDWVPLFEVSHSESRCPAPMIIPLNCATSHSDLVLRRRLPAWLKRWTTIESFCSFTRFRTATIR